MRVEGSDVDRRPLAETYPGRRSATLYPLRGGQTSREGDRTVKFELRKALKKFGIEPTGDLFDRAYAYVAEHSIGGLGNSIGETA